VTDLVIRTESVTPFDGYVLIGYSAAASDGTSWQSAVYVSAETTGAARNVAILAEARAWATSTFGITAGTDTLIGGESDWVHLVKRIDQMVENSTVLVDDDTLRFLTVAGKTYTFRLMVYFRTGSIPDFKYRLIHTGTHSNVSRRILRGGAGVAPAEQIPATDFDTADVPLTGAAVHGIVQEDGRFVCESAGEVKFQWAQNTSGSQQVFVLRGSYLDWDDGV
jgi:hypothetical protein